MASADRPLTLHDLPEELLPLLADLLVGKQSSLAWGFHDQARRAATLQVFMKLRVRISSVFRSPDSRGLRYFSLFTWFFRPFTGLGLFRFEHALERHSA